MSLLAESRAGRVAGWPLAVLRVYGGLVFTAAAAAQWRGTRSWALSGPWLISPAWPASVHGMVVVAEVLVGIALLLGVATRAAAALGMVLVAAFVLSGHPTILTLASPGPVMANGALLLTVALGRAGRIWGLDSVLAVRHPRSQLW